MTEFTVTEDTLFRVATFRTKRSAKYNFLGINEIWNIQQTNNTNLDC